MKKMLIILLTVLLAFSAAACTAQNKADDTQTAVQGDHAAADGVIFFDAASVGWENASSIRFFISDPDNGELAPWGSKKLSGTKGENALWSFDAAGLGVETNRVYILILENADTNDMTYPLLMDSSCFGDTVYADSRVLEDPSDSDKKRYEARWRNNTLGPMLQITSIGNVTGETVLPNTTAYQMLVDFLTADGNTGLTYALQYSGRDVQSSIDAIAGALGLTKVDVAKAIEEAKTTGNSVTGKKVDWSDHWDADRAEIETLPIISDKNGF